MQAIEAFPATEDVTGLPLAAHGVAVRMAVPERVRQSMGQH